MSNDEILLKISCTATVAADIQSNAFVQKRPLYSKQPQEWWDESNIHGNYYASNSMLMNCWLSLFTKQLVSYLELFVKHCSTCNNEIQMQKTLSWRKKLVKLCKNTLTLHNRKCVPRTYNGLVTVGFWSGESNLEYESTFELLLDTDKWYIKRVLWWCQQINGESGLPFNTIFIVPKSLHPKQDPYSCLHSEAMWHRLTDVQDQQS